MQAFTAFAQLNFKLNNEVYARQTYTQEVKNLQIKLADELKVATLKTSELESKLEAKDSDIKEKDSRIKEL